MATKGGSSMWNSLSRYLNDLSHHVLSLPVFHGFQVIGAGVAVGGLIIWLATIHWSINVRWKLLGRMAGSLGLIGLALWVVGWLMGSFVVVLLLVAAIVAVVFLAE